ncbi:MAG: RHS repeat-associated core domain-containing protein, partial [Thermodesulfobacteriota bacterium]
LPDDSYSGVTFPYLYLKEDLLYDTQAGARRFVIQFTYDGYGNVVRSWNVGHDNTVPDTKDNYIDYNYDTTNWRLSSPNHTYLKNQAGDIKTEAWFTYKATTNDLEKEEAWLDGGDNSFTDYGHDDYGNIISIHDPNGNPPTTITYDSATHTFPYQVTNPAGHTVTTVYDAKFGKVAAATDANDFTTDFYYDELGRIEKEVNELDVSATYGTVSYTYEDIGDPIIQNIITRRTQVNGTGQTLWSITSFDGLGRVWKTEVEADYGKSIVQKTAYDERGLVVSNSLPFFKGLAAEYITFTYDPIGRLLTTTNPDGTSALWVYVKEKTFITDENGNIMKYEKDAYGNNVMSVEFLNGQVNASTDYVYDAMDNLVQVIDEFANTTTMDYDTLGRKTSMTDPDMGQWLYTYDLNGNMKTQTDAIGDTIDFSYDSINRLTLKDYPTGTDATYTYDEPTASEDQFGYLTSTTDASGSSSYEYDKLGRQVKAAKTVGQNTYTVESTYDAFDNIRSIIYPDNEVVNYNYSSGGNLSTVGNYATYSDYTPLGQVGTITYNNGVITDYTYSALNNRLELVETDDPGAVSLIDRTYSYDNIGNVLGIADGIDGNNSQTFVYDHLDRLTSASSTSYPATRNYEYDKIGNLTSKAGVTYTYGAGSAGPHAVTSTSDGKTYLYDANGSMTSIYEGFSNTRTITYDYDNMPSEITDGSATVDFIYDATGQRVMKDSGTSTTIYIGDLYECTDSVCSNYIFGGTMRVAQNQASTIYYYHKDHLGSTSVVTGSDGSMKETAEYYPFGELRARSGSFESDYKFTDQELDLETGLYYYGARYYDPVLARFISADTIVPEPLNPQALNRYSYVLNNPLIYIDPTGHAFDEAIDTSSYHLETGYGQNFSFDSSNFGFLANDFSASFGVGGNPANFDAITGLGGVLNTGVVEWHKKAVYESGYLADYHLEKNENFAAYYFYKGLQGFVKYGALSGLIDAPFILFGNSIKAPAKLGEEGVEFLLRSWSKATSGFALKTAKEHYVKRGMGMGIIKFTLEGLEFFNKYKGTKFATSGHPLNIGGTGIKITTKTHFGIYENSGLMISYGARNAKKIK